MFQQATSRFRPRSRFSKALWLILLLSVTVLSDDGSARVFTSIERSSVGRAGGHAA